MKTGNPPNYTLTKRPATKGLATKGPATKGPGYERSGCKRSERKGPDAKGPDSFFCQICIFEAGPFEDGRFVGVPNVPSQGLRI